MGRVGIPVEHMTDETLLAGLSNGEPDVALAFVRRFQGHVYAVALAIVGERAGAEDVTQQAFERAWRKAESFDPSRGSVRTWLTTITRNLALDSVRRRRTDPVDPADLVRLLGSSSDQPEEASIRGEARDMLREQVRRLPPEQARAVVMAGIYRMTAQAVADAEGIPLGTAKTRIRVAMIKLREQMAPTEVTHD
jgi:RNA polymerase sigma factor (sigma-70 family)